MQFWKNDLPNQMCFLPSGKKIGTDFTADGAAWLATEIGFVNQQIQNAVERGMCGWVPVTQENYEAALKKNSTQTAVLQKQSPAWFRAQKLRQPAHSALAVAGSVAAKRGVEVPAQPRPDPIRVPTPEQMRPRKGPIPKEAII